MPDYDKDKRIIRELAKKVAEIVVSTVRSVVELPQTTEVASLPLEEKVPADPVMLMVGESPYLNLAP